ncbi:MAG: OmpH family outer membrane protein [Cypionkella sp.]|nr:OmpH family outer membrane protein [Cypionkella sp.]
MGQGRIFGIARRLVFTAALVFVVPPSGVWAQDTGGQDVALSPILSLDQERLFSDSKFGQALRAELDAQSAKVEAESRKIDGELETEERALTQKRSILPPEEFAPLAVEFDAKVERLRAEREAAVEDLRAREVAGRQRFIQTATQVIGDYMVERRAVAIIDKNAVIVSLRNMDVTNDIIEKLDAILGDGRAAAP